MYYSCNCHRGLCDVCGYNNLQKWRERERERERERDINLTTLQNHIASTYLSCLRRSSVKYSQLHIHVYKQRYMYYSNNKALLVKDSHLFRVRQASIEGKDQQLHALLRATWVLSIICTCISSRMYMSAHSRVYNVCLYCRHVHGIAMWLYTKPLSGSTGMLNPWMRIIFCKPENHCQTCLLEFKSPLYKYGL